MAIVIEEIIAGTLARNNALILSINKKLNFEIISVLIFHYLVQ